MTGSNAASRRTEAHSDSTLSCGSSGPGNAGNGSTESPAGRQIVAFRPAAFRRGERLRVGSFGELCLGEADPLGATGCVGGDVLVERQLQRAEL